MLDYLIVGSGFGGSVIAERLAKSGKKILVIDKRPHVGGNCYDTRDQNNILIHKYGPHLFHTNNTEVWEYVSNFTNWIPYEHHVLAFVDGKNIPLPFNFNTLYEAFPTDVAKSLEEKLLSIYPSGSKIPILELKKSNDKELQHLADYIYNNIFLNYSAKQWGLKPEEMDGAVTARVPILLERDNRYFNDIHQAVPQNGYTKLFEKLLAHPNIQIMLNTDFKDIVSIQGEKIYLFGQKFNGQIIYTGKIDELFDYQFGELPYRSVKMEFELINQKYYQEAATINYPNHHAFTRITEFKHIHFIECATTTILKEYPEKYIRGQNTPYYPIFTDQNQKLYTKYVEYAKNYPNITLLGRLAEYKYYDMDDIVEKALQLSSILLNKEEL